MTGSKIPFTGLKRQYTDLREELLAATDAVMSSGVLMDGTYTQELEQWLAQRNRSRHAITCHSGTSALECIAEFYATEAGMPNPPRALIPSLTYTATANAFMRAGWEIEFGDVDANGIIDLRRIDTSSSLQAVILVGLYGASIGHLGSLQVWKKLKFHEIMLIEDAAQHWLANDSVRLGIASAISFDPMKNLPASGNGGAVITSDSTLWEFAQQWRNNGKHNHDNTGTNSRMSEIDCSHILVRSRYIDQWQQRRARIAHYYIKRFAGSSVRSLIDAENILGHSFHKFVIDSDHRDRIKSRLAEQGIETRIHYAQPLHEVSVFRQWPGPGMLSNASALSRRILSLPCYPEMTDAEVETVADQVLAAVNSSGCSITA